MRSGMIALALGLVTLRWLPALPPGWLLLMIALLAGAALLCRWPGVGLYLSGLCWACLAAHWALDDRLSPGLDGRTLWLEGVVAGLPETGDGVVRFELVQATSRHGALPARLRLNWRAAPALHAGQRWRLAVTLKRPRGQVNPAGFDYQAWLLARGAGATGSVKAGQQLSAPQPGWREALRQRLLQVDSQGREGTLAALVLGDKSAVSRQDWQTVQATGTVHLLVISGQHIGLLAGLLYGLVAGLARLGAWPLRLPWLPCACALAMLGALAYGWLADFQVPVRRACLMLALVLCWRLRYRQLAIGWPLLVAFVVVLLLDPLASLQSGFWLSFAAVAVLLLVFAGRLGGWRWWQAWTRAQWLIAIGLLPGLLALALPVSPSAPLANLLAVPWISLLVLPLALLGTALLGLWPVLGEALLWLAGGLLNLLFAVLERLGGALPPWHSGERSAWLLVLIGLGALLLLLPAGVPLRVLGWPLLLLAVLPPRNLVPPGEVEVWQLDVGQGLALVLRTRHHSLVYDAGPAAAGERVLLPVLRTLGVERLDLLILSHAHADHAGGALSLARGLPVSRTLAGEPLAMEPELQAQACRSGQRWQWDGVEFALWQWQGATDSNSASCVLHVRAQSGEALLLGGDIEAAAERALHASGIDVAAHWLQAPHHGSRTSSTAPLLEAVRPAAVLISRGYGNGFGHPHPQVSARFHALGIRQYDTALHGAIRVQLGRFGEPFYQRQQRRFWRDDDVPAP
ncbi:DNA internalization-related competence protein ComEC/Rec2 [Pseudomonas sp. HR96]|uniref:DNA internalization-related competence protein ComEC/Rec2 n=1 Tax=Pseudomonas sp. HR96 TaxID=1027966 RepID=UPI002A762D64|nr:DNA internalization-related competence protein ComEC/Rec2 [Pseudomonas sp. HR96]WPO98773.1 DNA internalization-related competence protein ComEC/Rec2 [Pseudomonas sp. HR96]